MCDDEYWLTPEGEPSFKQPPDKPSRVTAFVYMLRLGQILAFAMRTIVSGLARAMGPALTMIYLQYATNKSRAQLGRSDEQWEQRIVADLDSALNKWSDSLPSHRERPRVSRLTSVLLFSVAHGFRWCPLQCAGIRSRKTCPS